ncbi:hypothetical protein ACROYT_G019331 [Oculina patagonica]
MKGNNISEANTRRAIEKNRRELAELHITYNRLEKDCKEKCAFVDAERAHFLKHKHAIPNISVTKSSQHNEGHDRLLPTIVTSLDTELPSMLSGRIRAHSDVTAERKTVDSLHLKTRTFSARSHSTGSLQASTESLQASQNNVEHFESDTIHLPRCSPEVGLVSRKVGKFKILGFSVMTLAVLSNSINDSTRLEALDLPFNEHIVRRKIQSKRELGEKLNEVRNLRYLRTGRHSTL